MRTYTISELEPEAKERALQSIIDDINFREKDVDLDWVIEAEQDGLEAEFGLANVEISFSGFWSKGDGASFTGRVVDIPKFIRAIGIKDEILDKAMQALEDVYEMSIVRIDSRYVHENTVRFDLDPIDDTELILMSPFGIGDITLDLNDLLVEIGLEDKASKWVKERSREIYDKLEKAYEYEFSGEVAEEWADQWEIQFDKEGNEIN
jgi:hypothetical protein